MDYSPCTLEVKGAAVNRLSQVRALTRGFMLVHFKILFENYKNFCYNIFRKIEEKKTSYWKCNFLEYFLYLFFDIKINNMDNKNI